MTRPLTLLLVLLLTLPAGGAPRKNGFDLEGALLPAEAIRPGGPPRDGIPAIDRPRFDTPRQATWLHPDDRVLGLEHDGAVRAYPIRILDWHEIVNDRIGADLVVVSYCPLCGTGVAFVLPDSRESGGFGVSGLLYNSDVLFYDRASQSLWSQILMQAVSGPRKGERLTPLPLEHTTWRDWRDRHPDTRVLSRDTGHRRNYDRGPYGDYAQRDDLYFPVSHLDRRYPPKERVLGIVIDGDPRVWPFSELAGAGALIHDCVGGQKVEVRFHKMNGSARLLDRDGRPLPAVTGYWFAWMAFHPDSRVFTAHETSAAPMD